jgi:Ca2+-binding RTX toxin-like protein
VFDRAPSSANYDHIVDFAHGADKIRLDDDIFTTLALGNLASTAFKDISAGAKDADDRVIYNHNNGGLYYDSDGSGAAAQVLIAILDNHATMTASDFFVIA